MKRSIFAFILLTCFFSCIVFAQQRAGSATRRGMRFGRSMQGGTRPPENNERGVRELTPEEIALIWT